MALKEYKSGTTFPGVVGRTADVSSPVTIPNQLGLGAAVTIGADPGSPTTPDYQPPFAFTGAIKRALVDVTGTHIEDTEAKMRVYVARQ
jgi:arylsulfatase